MVMAVALIPVVSLIAPSVCLLLVLSLLPSCFILDLYLLLLDVEEVLTLPMDFFHHTYFRYKFCCFILCDKLLKSVHFFLVIIFCNDLDTVTYFRFIGTDEDLA